MGNGQWAMGNKPRRSDIPKPFSRFFFAFIVHCPLPIVPFSP
jgi:hypothetical protein